MIKLTRSIRLLLRLRGEKMAIKYHAEFGNTNFRLSENNEFGIGFNHVMDVLQASLD